MKQNWLNRTLMQCAYKFTLCTDEKQFHKILRLLDLPRHEWPPFLSTPQSHATTHYFENTNDRCAVVCIKPRDDIDPIEIAALLTHEAVHIWQEHCGFIGERHPSSEHEAYAIQWLAAGLMYEYRDQVEKNA